MKKLFLLLLLLVSSALSQTTLCEDAAFESLRNRPVSEMSEREYEYFMLLSRECLQLQRQITDTQKESDSTEAWELYKIERTRMWDNFMRKMTVYTGVYVLAVSVYTAFIIAVEISG